ncbi:hypothetical protein LTR62_001056 [Meristemomyces frigidus]|uniref:Uncharacterized protein n=1 Tax=Meristemomyces frigidus TaxID=1508187 RepID=A0AAN7TK01_9PEZI|nr:hypothetical protein LTR62_001056 [Meristemomyces frigidus]
MTDGRLSSAPMDPYEWRESVLSTRSLSYLSTIDAHGGPSTSMRPHPLTATSESDYGVGEDQEMADTTTTLDHTRDLTELPVSVANCPLFTLPREIRDRVYTFCLTAANSQPIEWPPLPNLKPLYGLQTQLLRTCRIISAETTPLLYNLNTLSFHHPSDANMLVRALTNTATSRRHITRLILHIRYSDTRLWMPYLSSTDMKRSLKHDFPCLRELGVRWRSNKWNHSFSAEQNLRTVWEDARLDEVIDGLRGLYFPPPPPPTGWLGSVALALGGHRVDGGHGTRPLNEMNESEFMRFVDARRPGEDMTFKQQLLDLHLLHAPAACHRPVSPRVRVMCACRVHSAHFNTLTAARSGAPTFPLHDNPHVHNLHHHALGPHGHILPAAAAALPVENIYPVQEGDRFRSFTALDLSPESVRRVQDPELGAAKVARTVFADRRGVGVALEIYCGDSGRREGVEPAGALGIST